MIGRAIHHYRVTDRLGTGGMGVVWRAEDVRLGRQVALKVLRGDLAHPDLLDRFEAEARLASAINHPHIVSVYDVGSVDDERFIAMELVEGTSLDALLASRRLGIDEIVQWGRQVAEALAAAHAAGVVHRDVKPANIFVSRTGYVKLGDFGIAKLRETSADPARTVTTGSTAGLVIGSPHYLSPEQAQGEPIDARTDIFSFAAALYEMVTGRRAFEGASVADVIAAVLREDPAPVSAIRADAPPALERIISKGLEKRREYRYQHMDDVIADLKRLERDLQSGRAPERTGEAAGAARARGRQTPLAVAAALLGAAAAGFAAGWWAAPPGDGDVTYEVVRMTSAPGLEAEPSWSPDGRSVAYTSDQAGHLGIWIRQIPGERALPVSMSGVDEGQPAWSPDGSRLAFVSARHRGGRFGIFLGSRAIEAYVIGQGGDLLVMPALGGTARKLAEDAYDPTWSPDGARLAFRSIRDGAWRLYTVALDSGRISPLEGVEPRALAPAWSPDGRWIAYVGSASAATGWDIYVVPAEGGSPIQLTSDRTTITLAPAWSRDSDWITYSSNRAGPLNLWRVRFDADRLAPDGPPERLTTGVGEDVGAAVNGGGIAYATVHTAPNVWTVDVESRQLRQLTFETTIEDYPRLSPDGRRLMFYSDRTGQEEVWILELESGALTRVSRSGGSQNAWAPDGRDVAYGSPAGLQLVHLDTGETRVLSRLSAAYPAFSRDGRRLAFQGWDGRDYRLYHVPVAGGEPEPIPTPEGEPGNPSWSPDGRTIYFQLDQFGRRNIWSVDLETGQSRQLTRGDTDDAHPDVSSDGRRLLFLREHRGVYVMPADGTGAPALIHGVAERSRVVEWPAWGPDDASIVFSVAEVTGDLFLLRPQK